MIHNKMYLNAYSIWILLPRYQKKLYTTFKVSIKHRIFKPTHNVQRYEVLFFSKLSTNDPK